MKILLVANYSPDRQVSMQRFADALERGLRSRGADVHVLRPAAVVGPTSADGSAGAKWRGYVDKFVLFPTALRRAARRVDLVHVCDHSNAMYVTALGAHPHVVTCHDVIAIRAGLGLDPTWRVGRAGRAFQRLILRGLRQAQHVACVSQLTREQLSELLPSASARISLVSNGLNAAFAPLPAPETSSWLAALGLPREPYFLFVGSALPRKNRAGVIRIFDEVLKLRPDLPHRLVLAGAGVDADIASPLGASPHRDRIRVLADVSAGSLTALYSGAEALIFPSLAEGFGWPVIEAHACGCPAFVSNRRPMTDIGGRAAVAIDPLDAVAAAARMVAELPMLGNLRAAAIENAAQYSAESMTSGYVDLYQRLCRAPGAFAHPEPARPHA